MKNNWAVKLGVLAVVLTLITLSMVSGTFAKYTTQVTGSDTVVVAKWNAKFEGSTAGAISTFDLFNTSTDNGVADVTGGGIIAPGTSGTFNVDYDTSGTQAKRHVSIIMGASNLSDLTYLKFYKGTSPSGIELTPSAIQAGTASLLDATFEAGDPGAGTVDLYWVWPFDNGDDIADTADGINPITNGKVTITFSAIQLDN